MGDCGADPTLRLRKWGGAGRLGGGGGSEEVEDKAMAPTWLAIEPAIGDAGAVTENGEFGFQVDVGTVGCKFPPVPPNIPPSPIPICDGAPVGDGLD